VRTNLTLTLSQELLLQARKLALERGTSVNQLVREYLVMLVSEEGRRRRARAHLKAAFAKGVIEIGKRNWKREDLYERR
jgi:hypothetical protein